MLQNFQFFCTTFLSLSTVVQLNHDHWCICLWQLDPVQEIGFYVGDNVIYTLHGPFSYPYPITWLVNVQILPLSHSVPVGVTLLVPDGIIDEHTTVYRLF